MKKQRMFIYIDFLVEKFMKIIINKLDRKRVWKIRKK
jgi:hypothetical protein